MIYEKDTFLYEGKAKSIYSVLGQQNLIWIKFKDDITAFNSLKKESLPGKGALNHYISSTIFNYLSAHGVEVHTQKYVDTHNVVCKKLKMIPLEVVVRNVASGSLVKRFGLSEGEVLTSPIFELFYKNDQLGDPFMNGDHAIMVGAVDSEDQIQQIKELAFTVNQQLQSFFLKLNIQLVDFKIELGWDFCGTLVLGDEISPDSCRLWDISSQQKLDKDVFRLELGDVIHSYQEIKNRIKEHWGQYENRSQGFTQK